jgi:alkyl hydroperoxide reductase subunit F
MLDPSIVAQLVSLFADLETELTLALAPSDHPKQAELRAMLEAVAGASPRIHVVETANPTDGAAASAESAGVRFEILKDGVPTGVVFRAVPGGHEFSSLVLALLHAAGRGKLPDGATVARIRALRGPIDVRSYVSLECTNCPDVVQALNLIALLHGDLRHETIDGGLFEREIAARNIRAVPTVMLGDEVLHVGRGSLGELLAKLEERFGRARTTVAEDVARAGAVEVYDVVVVGGGPAGCSAAIYSARKGLKTALVADRVGGQVLETLGIENLVSVPRTEGARLSADLERHVREYPIDVLEHRKVESLREGGPDQPKLLLLKGGERLEARSVILALGAKWRELGVPGEREYLGRGVAFCPHCDGPFYKGRRVAVVGGGNSGVEAAIDLAGLCSKVTLVEYLDQLKADDVLLRRLRSLANVEVITGARVTELVGDGTAVTAVRYQDRASGAPLEVALDGVFVQIGLVPNSAMVKGVVELNAHGEVVVDAKGRTSVPGVYAAGDVTTVPYKQIVIAMGDGAKAALTAFEDRIRAA